MQLRCSGHLGAGRGQDVGADLVDERGLLCQRDELGRRDRTEFGVVPPQEGFECDECSAIGGHDRLIVDLQLGRVGGQCATEFLLDALAALELISVMCPKLDVGFSRYLARLIQSNIGVAKEVCRGVAVAGRHGGDADAHPHRQGFAAVGHTHRRPDRSAYRLDPALDLRRRVRPGVGGDQDELVSPDPAHRALPGRRTRESLGDGVQHLVADGVTERVVDQFEVVEIDVIDRDATRFVFGECIQV